MATKRELRGDHEHPGTPGNQDENNKRTATDWWGPDDEGNPQNWPTGKKLFHTIVPPAVGFLCPFGSSVYTPGHRQVMNLFGVPREVAQLPFAFYLLGLSFGPILASPTSETLGRKIVYLSCLPVFAAFTVGAGFSQNIQSLIICRFFAGLFSSTGLSIGTGTIADIWPPEKRGAPMSMFVLMVQMGPALGPVIGGFVTAEQSWRWTQWVICFGIVIAFSIVVFMSETYKKTILQKRAKALGIPGPPSVMQDRTLGQTLRFFATKTILRPLHMLFTEPIVMFFDVYVAFNFGLLNAFFAAFSWTFETVYGFSITQQGLTYLGQAVGSLIGTGMILFVYKYNWSRKAAQVKKQYDSDAKMSPDERLIIAMIGAPMIPVGLFWFAWTARADIHWILPVIAEGFFSCGNILVFTCATLYLTDCYGALYGASAWASNTFARYLMSFAFPLFAVRMYEGLGVGWATSLLGFISVLLATVPFVCFRYGAAMRSRSSYASGE